MPKGPIYFDSAPEYPEEQQFKNKLWDDAPEPQETPEQAIARQIEEKRLKTPPSPIPAPTKPTLGSLAKGETEPAIVHGLDCAMHKFEQEMIPKKDSSSAERKKRWRARHGEEAKRKEREYLKAWRAKRKNQSQ